MTVSFFSFSEANRHIVAKIKGRAHNVKYPHLKFKVQDLLKRWYTEDEAVIRQAISKRLKGSGRTIVFVGKHTRKSKWVPIEVEMTLAKKKKVYAIWLKNESGTPPKCLINNNIYIYKWSEARLQDLATR